MARFAVGYRSLRSPAWKMGQRLSETFRGGKWLAEDRGAFDDPPPERVLLPDARPETRPLPLFPLPWLIRAADDYTQQWLLEHRVRPV